MEWVETVGRSIQEAKEAALDELGVDATDAEFEIVADAQVGLFGRVRSEARVRARVKPRTPRAKEDRRDRKRRASAKSGGEPPQASDPIQSTDVPDSVESRQSNPLGLDDNAVRRRRAGSNPSDKIGTSRAKRVSPDSSRNVAPGIESGSNTSDSEPDVDGDPLGYSTVDAVEGDSTKGSELEVDLERQSEVAMQFVEGLLNEFGVRATVSAIRPDEDTVELQVNGEDLGILIGPKGLTLLAIQTLTRTAVFNQTGGSNGHINVDVGGYRSKRSDALVRFAQQVAGQVRESGKRAPLEPMPSPDRKVLHDAIAEIDGVHTISEGEEPNRRVVVLPD